MRKSFLLLMFAFVALSANAQKFALIDMEYIMEKIPAYQKATEQLDQSSRVWQAELERIADEAKSLYEKYQKEAKNLTEAQRTQREEKEVAELRRNYFGPEGEMAKKQASLLQPIEDEIYEAVKAIALQQGYAAVLDRASATSLIFASPDIDISNEVLIKLGYSN